jgi:hypothetical protein
LSREFNNKIVLAVAKDRLQLYGKGKTFYIREGLLKKIEKKLSGKAGTQEFNKPIVQVGRSNAFDDARTRAEEI